MAAPTPQQLQDEIDALKRQLAERDAPRPWAVTQWLGRVWSRVKAGAAQAVTVNPIKAGWVTWQTAGVAWLLGLGTLFSGCPSPIVPPGPPPLPGDGNRVLIVYDASTKQDADYQSAMYAEDVWRYVNASVSGAADGSKEARLFDVDADMSNERQVWKDWHAKAKGQELPYLMIQGKSTYAGKLPKGADAKEKMVALLKQHLGEKKLPAFSRASHGAIELTEDDLDAKGRKTGLTKRDFKLQPFGSLAVAPPFDLPLMSDAELEAAITRKNADNSHLDNIRDRGKNGDRMPSLDQDGKGYCWTHSSCNAVRLVRASNNQPYSDLSAYAVACILKGYRDEGGWGILSLQFIADRGIPSSKFWPQQSMSRANDRPETWADAKLHRVTEWMELEPRNKRQLATCLANNIPVVCDFNWWGHSVCAVRLLSWGKDGSNLKIRIFNSWGDGWSQNGMGDLTGSKAIPDGQVAPRVVTAAFANKREERPSSRGVAVSDRREDVAP